MMEKCKVMQEGVATLLPSADVVVFDPAVVADLATFAEPLQPSAGIQAVLVNGQLVEEGGAPTGARPGRLLRGAERAAPGFETPAWAA